MIPGCPVEELLDVAHVIVKTLRSIEGRILEKNIYFIDSAIARRVQLIETTVFYYTCDICSILQVIQNKKYTSPSF